MSRAKLICSSLLLAGLIACGQKKEEPKSEVQPAPQPAPVQEPVAKPAEPAATPQPAEQPQPVVRSAAKKQAPSPAPRPAPKVNQTEPEPERRAPATATERAVVTQPVAPAPARPLSAVVPAGTRIDVRLTEPISSKESKSGDKFETLLSEDLEIDGRVVAPRGTKVTGRLSRVERSGKVEGRAHLAMTLTQITVRGETYDLDTNTLTFEAEGSKKDDAVKIGAGAGIGAAIGAIAGGAKGAAIGATIGGGAGTATVLATRGKEVEFPAEQKFAFRLERDLQVKLR